MAKKKSDFTLPTLDSLFSTQQEREYEKLDKIRDIPLELIDDFPDHPYKVKDDEDFNCMFCYCPLYALGDKCGGNFKYIEMGIKDCSDCLIPHSENGYQYINSKFFEIVELAKKKD